MLAGPDGQAYFSANENDCQSFSASIPVSYTHLDVYKRQKHTLSVLVENKPGVLARIAGLFSRRSFNIDSLAVGPTEHPDISRMTVVVDVDEAPLELSLLHI